MRGRGGRGGVRVPDPAVSDEKSNEAFGWEGWGGFGGFGGFGGLGVGLILLWPTGTEELKAPKGGKEKSRFGDG